MTAAEDGLVDALTTIQAARAELEKGDLSAAVMNLCHAHRFHALALGMHPASTPATHGFQANADEVNTKLRALQADVLAFARPAIAPMPAVVEALAQAISPIAWELQQGADPADVVRARARNAAAALCDTFDIRTTNRKDPTQ